MRGRQLTVSLLPIQIIDGGTFDHLRENDNNPHVELGLFHSLAELHPTPLHDACGHVLPGANKDVSVSPPCHGLHPCQACPKLVYRLGAGSNVKCRTSIPIRPKPISNRSETRGSAPLGSTFCFEDFPPAPLTLLVVASFCFCFCQFALSTCDTDSCSVPGSP